jgi:L-lactate dehydrogenase complex protein LldF
MSESASTFKAKSTIKSADLDHRKKINFNIGKYNAVVPTGKQQFENIDFVRERAKNIKWRALETLDQQLEEFEMNFTKRGGKVIWAIDSQEALDEVLKICQDKNCKAVVKSKTFCRKTSYTAEIIS